MTSPSDNVQTPDDTPETPSETTIENLEIDSPHDTPETVTEEADAGEMADLLTPPTVEAPDAPALPSDVARDATGAVIFKADGTPAKRRGRKAGAKAQVTTAPQSVSKAIDPGAVATAAALVCLGTQALTLALGDEWKLQGDAELNELALPLGAYLESQGVSDAPPGVVFIAALIGYAVKRTAHENTRTKFMVAAVKVRGFFGNVFGKLFGK